MGIRGRWLESEKGSRRGRVFRAVVGERGRLVLRVLLGCRSYRCSQLQARVPGKGEPVDFSEEETGMLGFKKSEYSSIGLIHAVNIIDQDRRRGNETVTTDWSNNFQKRRYHPRCASDGSNVASKFDGFRK
jgi:hypothetical protein